MNRLAAAICAALLATPALAQTPADDPYLWLEAVEDPKALAWAEAENVKSAGVLEKDARYAPMLAEARAIFTAQDRIPTPHFRAGGIDNFWQDATHVKGVWRHASLDSYRSDAPQWRTILDMDALGKAENRNLIWKGATCRKPAETACLVRISDGGGDAVEIREFDAAAGRFVEGGFRLGEARQNADWVDADTLVVARPWTPTEVTRSNYAYIVKLVRRDGTAREIFRGQPSDTQIIPTVLRGEGGRTDAILARRGVTFFENEYYLVGDGAPARVPLPARSAYQGYVGGQAIFVVREPWRDFKPGALIAYDLAALKAGNAKPQLIMTPARQQAVQSVSTTKTKLIVNLLENVTGAVEVYTPANGRWTSRRQGLPQGAFNTAIVDTDGSTDQFFLTVEGFLTPTALFLSDAAKGSGMALKVLPARFNAKKHVVEQRWATSGDGTRIPYFLVRPRGAKRDGSLPTLMFGYGGFENSYPPAYKPELGKLWLERGGAYVIANIRGGGEFGPAWHQAALRDKRQVAFDDFAAVAKDLHAAKITSPRRLGIYGRSNGGVLTTVSMTQHPELWNAIVIESPLIDMLRYQKLSVGASWIGEYGDPDIPADREFIAKYSAYQTVKKGEKYPLVYITTNTRDDRVHPGHARKYAARLAEYGIPYLYYEQTFGGHANDADPELNARRWARHYVYLAQRLMD